MDEPLVTPWRPVEAIPIGLASLSASLLVWVALTAGKGTGGATDYQIVGLVQQALFLGLSVAWVGVRHRRGVSALGLRSARASRDLAVGAWFGAGLFVFAVMLLQLIIILWRAVAGVPPDPIQQPILSSDPSTFQIVLGAVVVVVAAPLGEEVFFRGFLFGSLRGRLGFLPAAAISGLVFGVFHVDPQLVMVMFFVGFALAWIYERRGSLVAAIAAHAMFNVIGYTFLLLEPS